MSGKEDDYIDLTLEKGIILKVPKDELDDFKDKYKLKPKDIWKEAKAETCSMKIQPQRKLSLLLKVFDYKDIVIDISGSDLWVLAPTNPVFCSIEVQGTNIGNTQIFIRWEHLATELVNKLTKTGAKEMSDKDKAAYFRSFVQFIESIPVDETAKNDFIALINAIISDLDPEIE